MSSPDTPPPTQMTRLEHHRHCSKYSILRNARSGALAVAIVLLPKASAYVEHGAFTRESAVQLIQAVSVALLMLLFNYVQRVREEEVRKTARHSRRKAQRASQLSDE